MQQQKRQVTIVLAFIAVAFVSVAECHTSENEESSYRHRRTTNVCDSAACANPPTGLEYANRFSSADYTRNLLDPQTWINTPGGNVSYFNLSTNPVLSSIGVAFSLAMLEPCGAILPHIHPRGSKGIYMISGKSLQVCFIQENRAPLVCNTIVPGQAMAIPRGSVHFVQNLECTPAVELAAYNNHDPGLLSLFRNLFRFPNDPLAANFRENDNYIDRLREKLSVYPLDVNLACRRRCGFST